MNGVDQQHPLLASPQRLAMLSALAAACVVGAAWFTELAWGWLPCKLCLMQRWPYYAAIPLLLLAAMTGGSAARLLAGLAVLAFVAGAGLAGYHVGVEQGLFTGPTDCGGRIQAAPAGVSDFLKNLDTARIVRCNQPTLMWGVSMAVWNIMASVLLAGASAAAALTRRAPAVTA